VLLNGTRAQGRVAHASADAAEIDHFSPDNVSSGAWAIHNSRRQLM
jgi:hypothetical protein